MSLKKTVYSRADLFKIRETLFPPSEPHEDAAVPLPMFRAVAGTSVHEHAAAGSWRDGMLGQSTKGDGSLGPSRRSSHNHSMHPSASGNDLGIAQPSKLWVYRTKGRSNKSNPMMIKEIEQLVLDELVDAEEIELMSVSGPEVFVSLAEAQNMMAAVASHPMPPPSDAEHTSTTPVERWRPGAATVDRRQPRTVGQSLAGSRNSAASHQHNLPPKHLSISRDEMLGYDDMVKRRSPCGQVGSSISPPSQSPSNSAIVPTPIDALEDLGLGVVPTRPQPPCALGVDGTAADFAALSPNSKQLRISQIAAGLSPTKLRPPPPPVLCVDEPPAVSAEDANRPFEAVVALLSKETPVVAAVPCGPSATSDVIEGHLAPPTVHSPPPAKQSGSQARGSKLQRAEEPGPAANNRKTSSKMPSDAARKRDVAEVKDNSASDVAKSNVSHHLDPAIVSQGPATTIDVATAVAAPVEAAVDVSAAKGAGNKKRDSKVDSTARPAWGSDDKANGSSSKQQRKSKQPTPDASVAPSVDPHLYPTLDEVLNGEAPQPKAPPRQPKTLASIVAESARAGKPSAAAAPSLSVPKNEKPQQGKKPLTSASRGRGSK